MQSGRGLRVDPQIENLLKKWGRMWYSLDLGYPHRCAYLKDYRPKGYKEETADLDAPEVERLAEWMPWNLNTIHIHCLRIRYRQKVRNKRKAARLLNITEHLYRTRFNEAIRVIEKRF